MLTLIKHMENWGNSEQLDDFSSSQSLSLEIYNRFARYFDKFK